VRAALRTLRQVGRELGAQQAALRVVDITAPELPARHQQAAQVERAARAQEAFQLAQEESRALLLKLHAGRAPGTFSATSFPTARAAAAIAAAAPTRVGRLSFGGGVGASAGAKPPVRLVLDRAQFASVHAIFAS
jgi:hypothetical protein